MTDYTKLVEALRCCDKYALCNDCPIFETCDGDVDKAMAIAADAIEALQAEIRESMQTCAECGDEQEQKVKELQARLGEAENSVERWKDMYFTKHEPKRGEFEKSLHEMFDSIWDCDINHPIFQDTVGELMEAVLQAYDTVNRAKMEVQDDKA